MSNGYVSLTKEEFKALGKVSGECARLYIAVASFAHGKRTECWPKWSQLGEAMGKPLDRNNGRKMAQKLEEAGLLKRGVFGDANRWSLTLKKTIQEGRSVNDEAEKTTEVKPTPGVGNNGIIREVGSTSDMRSVLPPVKNKEIIKKDYSIEKKEDEERDWEAEGFILMDSGWQSVVKLADEIDKHRPEVIRNIYSVRDRSRMKEAFLQHGCEPLVVKINKAERHGQGWH
tara:strand:- start:18 stop:704 length:687 start_codon:yes stop_codon:yes gene_type:complete